jgi:hypothetical protein
MVTPALIELTAAIENVSTATELRQWSSNTGKPAGRAFVSMFNVSMLNAAGSRRGCSHAGWRTV